MAAADDELERTQAIRLVALGSSVLTVWGFAFILSAYVALRQLRSSQTFLLVLLLTACDCLSACAILVEFLSARSDATCVAVAALTQFSSVASFLWSACIAYAVHAILILDRPPTAARARGMHLLVWPLSAALTIIPGAAGTFGDAGLWCWIMTTAAGSWLRLVCYYLPLCAAFAYVAHAYVRVARQLTAGGAGSTAAADDRVIVRRLRLYMLVFVLCRGPSVLHRGYELLRLASAGRLPRSHALSALNAALSPLQGFGNALVYGANRTVLAQCAAWARAWAGGRQARLRRGDMLAERLEERVTTPGEPCAAEEFAREVDAIRRESRDAFNEACTRGADHSQLPWLQRWRARRALATECRAVLLAPLSAHLGRLADDASDRFARAQLQLVPGTKAYPSKLDAVARTTYRRFCSEARASAPRLLGCSPAWRRELRGTAARVRAELREQTDGMLRAHPPMEPPSDKAASTWWSRLSWQLVALALNLAQAQLQHWFALRAQRKRAAAAAAEAAVSDMPPIGAGAAGASEGQRGSRSRPHAGRRPPAPRDTTDGPTF